MKIWIAGMNHNDILGPHRLTNWIEHVKENEDSLPNFVGVESSQNIFSQIKMQRPLMKRFVQEIWPETNQEIQALFENSLLFEVDLHVNFFPTVKTIWMDQGRIVNDPTIISNYAKERMNIYRSFIPDCNKKLKIVDVEKMSKVSWAQANQTQSGGTNRDAMFAETILKQMNEAQSGWAIVIVGARHASRSPGTMLTRLIDAGISCEVTVLRP